MSIKFWWMRMTDCINSGSHHPYCRVLARCSSGTWWPAPEPNIANAVGDCLSRKLTKRSTAVERAVCGNRNVTCEPICGRRALGMLRVRRCARFPGRWAKLPNLFKVGLRASTEDPRLDVREPRRLDIP